LGGLAGDAFRDVSAGVPVEETAILLLYPNLLKSLLRRWPFNKRSQGIEKRLRWKPKTARAKVTRNMIQTAGARQGLVLLKRKIATIQWILRICPSFKIHSSAPPPCLTASSLRGQ